jgi:spore germination protein (amino acid permease)
MDSDEKISMKQTIMLFVIMFCAPAIRYIPLYTAEQAHQAAWLAPIISFLLEIIYMLVWCAFIQKYGGKSFVDIIKDICGNLMGNIICIIYFIWITLLLSYNVRMYGERIVSTSMNGVNIMLVIIVMLLLVGYIARKGLVPLAKMSEIFFYFLAIIFAIYNVLILTSIDVQNLFPITYKDALPVFGANFGIIAIFAYNILIFMFNDKIDHKDQFKKYSMKVIVTLTIISLLVIVIPLCVFGWSVLIKMPIPYLNTMMEISIADTIERIEGLIVVFWIITDFTLITAFVFAAINMIKVSFALSNVQPLIYTYIIFIFFLSMILANSTLELKGLSEKILTQFNIIMGYFLPILIFGIGKLRKKV